MSRLLALIVTVFALILTPACGHSTVPTVTQSLVAGEPGVRVIPHPGLLPDRGVAELRNSATPRFIYVADAGLKEILAYSAATDQLAPDKTIVLSAAPYDVAEDSTGTLYVSFLAASQIGVYKVGQLVRTISIEHPQAVTVDSHDNLYVGNGLKDWVSVFRPGASAPSRVIPMTGTFWLYGGLAVRNDVLYADVTAGAGAAVESCPLHLVAVHPCRITNGFGAYFGGVAFDAQGNMVVGGAGTFIWFKPPRWQQIAAHYLGKGEPIYYMTSDANGTVYAAVDGGGQPMFGKCSDSTMSEAAHRAFCERDANTQPYVAIIDGVGNVRTISGGLSHPLGVAVGR